MIYSQLGNDTQGLEYKDDPLARTIAPNYEKLSMSAWGIPQLDDMDKFAPKMLESLDTTPNEYTQYITNFNDLSQAAQKFMKMGVDITKPSLDPMQNAAHQEWLKKYNDNLALGYRLQQSRREKEKYNTMLGKAGVWTNPLDETKMVTSLDDLVYSPDFDTFEKGILAKAKKRELLFGIGQKELANAELQDIKRQLDTYPDSVPPAFKEHAKKRADYLKSLIPDAMDDLEAQDKSAYKWASLADKKAIEKAKLALGYAQYGLNKDRFEYGKSKDKVVEGQFGDIVENLIRTNGENEATFGHIQYNQLTGKPEFKPDVVYSRKAKDVPKTWGIKVQGTQSPNPDDNLFIVKTDKGYKTYNMSKPDEFQQFMQEYQKGHSFNENIVKAAMGVYDTENTDNGFQVVPDFIPAAVSKTIKDSETQSGSSKSSSVEKGRTSQSTETPRVLKTKSGITFTVK